MKTKPKIEPAHATGQDNVPKINLQEFLGTKSKEEIIATMLSLADNNAEVQKTLAFELNLKTGNISKITKDLLSEVDKLISKPPSG